MILYSKTSSKKIETSKEIITESISDMKLLHLYKDFSLSCDDIESIFSVILNGEFKGTEKVDGYNLKITYRNSQLYVARNKKEIEAGGLSYNSLMAREFAGGKAAKKIFLDAFDAIDELFTVIPERELVKCFPADQNLWYSCEIVTPDNNNFIKYEESNIFFHSVGTTFYENGTSKRISGVETDIYFNYLTELIKDKKVDGYSFLPTPEFTFKGLPDSSKIDSLIDSIKDFYGQYEVPTEASFKQLAAAILRNPKPTNADVADAVFPISNAIFFMGIEVLSGEESTLVKPNTGSINSSKEILKKAIAAAKNYAGENNDFVKNILDKNLHLLGGSSNFFNSTVEGVVFRWGSKFYKITGLFSPANQIVGLYNFGNNKKNIPPLKTYEKNTSNTGWAPLEAGDEFTEDEVIGRNIFLYPGAFKPPHAGHFEALQSVMNSQNQKVDKFLIIISQKSKFTDNNNFEIDANTSKYMWELFAREYENVEVIISNFDNPIKDVYDFIENTSEQNDRINFIKSEKDSDDKRFDKLNDFAQSKQKNIVIDSVIAPELKGVSSTLVRKALDSYNPSTIFDYMPGILSKEDRRNIWEKIFKKKDTRSAPDQGGGYTVLNEIAPHNVNKVFDFIDILKKLNKDLWIPMLGFGNIFDNRTRIVIPLTINRDYTTTEEFEKICSACGWQLNPYQKMVTKVIDGKIHQLRISKFLDKFINVLGKIMNSSNSTEIEKEKNAKILFFLTDFDESELSKKFKGLLNLYETISKLKKDYSDSNMREKIVSEGEYSIILSRHPIDIVRMGDHETMKSCFGEENEIACAIEDARNNGLTSYVVNNEELSRFNLDSDEFQNDEIFTDHDREIDGIVPVSRIRLIRVLNEKKQYEIAMPEINVYGKFKDEHYNTLKSFLGNIQDPYIFEKEEESLLNLSEFRHTGGYYLDSKIDDMFDSYFDTTFYSESDNKVVGISDSEETKYNYVFIEATKWIDRRLKLFKYDDSIIKKLSIVPNPLVYSVSTESFYVSAEFHVKIKSGVIPTNKNFKERVFRNLERLQKNITIRRTNSDIDFLKDGLLLGISCTVKANKEEVSEGFEQVEQVLNFIKAIEEKVSNGFLSQKDPVKSPQNLEDFEVEEDGESLILSYRESFEFKKFICPESWEPEIPDSIKSKKDYFNIGVEYITEAYDVSYKKVPADELYFLENILSKRRNNKDLGTFKLRFIIPKESYDNVLNSVSEIDNIGELVSNYLSKTFLSAELEVITTRIEDLRDPDNAENMEEFTIFDEMADAFEQFYDLNMNQSNFLEEYKQKTENVKSIDFSRILQPNKRKVEEVYNIYKSSIGEENQKIKNVLARFYSEIGLDNHLSISKNPDISILRFQDQSDYSTELKRTEIKTKLVLNTLQKIKNIEGLKDFLKTNTELDFDKFSTNKNNIDTNKIAYQIGSIKEIQRTDKFFKITSNIDEEIDFVTNENCLIQFFIPSTKINLEINEIENFDGNLLESFYVSTKIRLIPFSLNKDVVVVPENKFYGTKLTNYNKFDNFFSREQDMSVKQNLDSSYLKPLLSSRKVNNKKVVSDYKNFLGLKNE
jgi:phosphopantetheine adenylyltransferase